MKLSWRDEIAARVAGELERAATPDGVRRIAVRARTLAQALADETCMRDGHVAPPTSYFQDGITHVMSDTGSKPLPRFCQRCGGEMDNEPAKKKRKVKR